MFYVYVCLHPQHKKHGDFFSKKMCIEMWFLVPKMSRREDSVYVLRRSQIRLRPSSQNRGGEAGEFVESSRGGKGPGGESGGGGGEEGRSKEADSLAVASVSPVEPFLRIFAP